MGRLAVVGVLACLLAVPMAPPVGAQDLPDQPGPPAARLVVTELSGVVGPGAGTDRGGGDGPSDLDLRVLVENAGEVDLSSLQVVVEVHPAIGGARSLLQEALEDQDVDSPPLELRRIDVRGGEALAPGELAGIEATIPGDEIGWQGSGDVFPVQVSVLLGAEVLDRVVTAVVHLADDPEHPLQTTLVWPVDAPTRRTAAGRYEQRLPDQLAPGGRLDVLLTALEQHPDLPVLLAPGTVLVEELADRANGFTLVDDTTVEADDPAALEAADLLARLREVVGRTPLDPVIGPYGRADVSALAGGPEALDAMAHAAIDAARNRTQALLDRAPDLDLYHATTPVAPGALGVVNADHLLLSWEQVVGPDLANHPDLPHASRELVDARGQGVPRHATVADPHVAGILADPPLESGSTVVRQRLVAETAMLYLTEPGHAGRTLLVRPPVHWDPAQGTTEAVLQGLADSPWIELGHPTVAEETDPAVLRPQASGLPGAVGTDVVAAQDRLDALRAAMPDGTRDLEDQTVSDLEDALLRTLTPEALADLGAGARDGIRQVRDVAEGAFGSVDLVEGAEVTLTSDTGEVPITIERTRGAEIELLVEVESSNALRWDDEDRVQRLQLATGSSQTLSFGTRALSRGVFPVQINVWDPTEDKLLDTTTMSVRSTAISRTALLVVGGVVLALLLAGVVRRRRSPTLEVVR